jgi:uncharacterized protein YecT (DUF1311 family)
MKLTFLGLALALPVLACAEAPVPDERALREECGYDSQAGIEVCLAKKSKDSQKALRQAENRVVPALTRRSGGSKYVALSKKKLAATSKEFNKYRYAQCEFMASLCGGSMGYDFMRLACKAELNYRRAKQLRDVAAALNSKMPHDADAPNLAEKTENSQKALGQAEQGVASVSGWDDDKYVELTREKLAASSKAFIRYREAECGFMASISRSKNSDEIRRFACIAELNNRRTKQLLDAEADLQESAKMMREAVIVPVE